MDELQLEDAIDRLPELRELRVESDHIEIGAALTLTEIERRLDGDVPLLADLFPQFASRLIRNGATLGGNLGTGRIRGLRHIIEGALQASGRAGSRQVKDANIVRRRQRPDRHRHDLHLRRRALLTVRSSQ